MHFNYFRHEACIINDNWSNVDKVIHTMQWYPIHVKGNGFCFLYSIQEALSKDHNITLELPETRQLILDHLCCNTEKYLTFYKNISWDVLITHPTYFWRKLLDFLTRETSTQMLLIYWYKYVWMHCHWKSFFSKIAMEVYKYYRYQVAPL